MNASSLPRRPGAILLATDLSARSDRAMDRAVQLARQWQARLVVLAVLPADASFSRPHQLQGEGEDEDQTPPSPAELVQAQAERDLADAGVDTQIRVEHGDVAKTVQRVAAEMDCGLIVTGPGKRDALGQIELGSTVLWLCRNPGVPLLIVHDRVRGAYRELAVASDLSPANAAALQLTQAWFEDAAARSVVHAYDAPLRTHIGSQAERTAALHGLQSDAQDSVHAFLVDTLGQETAGRWDSTVALSRPVRLLRHHAQTRQSDLAVIATHGRSALADRLVGSVAKRLLETAPCDMLVVRRPDH